MANKAPFHVCLVDLPGSLSMPIAGLYEVLDAFPVVASFHDGVPASLPFALEIIGSATHEHDGKPAACRLPNLRSRFGRIDLRA